MMKTILILLLLSTFYCKVNESTPETSIKPIQPTFSIDGFNLSKFTIDTNFPHFGKGKLLSYTHIRKDLVSQLEFYLIKDFDVLYKLPSKTNGATLPQETCLEKSENRLELNSVRSFPINEEIGILILYQCLSQEGTAKDENYILDIYLQKGKYFQPPIRRIVNEGLIAKLNKKNSEHNGNLKTELTEIMK